MLRTVLSSCAMLLLLAGQAMALTVFAAASLKDALDPVADAFTAATGETVALSYGGSSALARQIAAGAPVDVFLSANEDWMDAIEDRILPGSRRDVLTNRLVLIAGPGGDATDLDAVVEDGGRIAMAFVDAVPAGIYGKAALDALGVWSDVQGRVVEADSVRAALALVAVGAAPYGVVYATDAEAEPRVRVVALFPADSHPPIRYPAAAIRGGDEAAALRFLDHMRGPKAQRIFRDAGFGLP